EVATHLRARRDHISKAWFGAVDKKKRVLGICDEVDKKILSGLSRERDRSGSRFVDFEEAFIRAARVYARGHMVSALLQTPSPPEKFKEFLIPEIEKIPDSKDRNPAGLT